MRKAFLLPLICLVLSAVHANAAKLTCTNSGNVPNVSLIGYSFSIAVPVSLSGSGAGVGKAVSTLTVQLPLSTNYAALNQMVLAGRTSPSCVLLDPSAATSPGQVEITMQNVVFSKIQLLSGPLYTPGRTATTVQLDLTYQSYTATQN